MDLSAAILGKSVAHDLAARQIAPVLTIGADRFDRHQLARAGCYHYAAAASLSRILAVEIRPMHTRDLFQNVHPERLILRRLGAVSLAVLGAAFELRHLGGRHPLESYFRLHRDGSLIAFATLKARHHDDPDLGAPRAAAPPAARPAEMSRRAGV